jgi:hypothetical protein
LNHKLKDFSLYNGSRGYAKRGPSAGRDRYNVPDRLQTMANGRTCSARL